MSKRKAPEGSGTAAGKQRVSEQDFDESEALASLMGADDLGADDLGGELDQEADLADMLGAADESGAEEDLLAGFGEDDGEEEDDGLDDEGGEIAESQPAEPFTAEVGELPDGLAEDALTDGETVDLSKFELTLEQARRVAQCLAQNDSLATVKLSNHKLSVGDLKEDDELEWDSEEYNDIDAIIIAELLRRNTSVVRLDLARNQIGDAGAYALANILGDNSTLEYLNLESNPFGEVGGVAFAQVIGGNSTLQYLNLKEIGLASAITDELKAAWQQGGRDIGLHL